MNPNNMRKALTAEDLIRMYDLNNLNKDRKQINITKENLKNQNKLINNFVEATTKGLNELQDQVDGNITTWFFCSVPTLDNQPSSQWQSKEEKINHLGDLYYDQNTGYAYRFALENEIFSWVKITDSDVTKALAIANSAQDTADSKRRVFIALPTTPYDVGDIWIKDDKELWRCRATRKNGAYSSVDWILATEYTNDDYAKNVEAVLNQFKTKVETDYVTKVKLETTKDSILSSVESTTTKIEHRLQNIEELNNTIKSNNELIVHDALEANAIEYKIKGKSEQKVTTIGKNKCPTSIDDWEQGQYSITGEKVPTTGRIRLKNLLKIVANTKYYFNLYNDTYRFVIRTYDVNKNFVKSVGIINNGATYTSTTEEYYIGVSIYSPDNANITFEEYETLFNDGTIKPFICLNSEINKNYEEYIPSSPSVDYPSEIRNVEGIEIDGERYLKIVNNNENLFDVNDIYTKHGDVIVNDEWVTISYNNISGTSNVFRNFWTKTTNKLKCNTDYAIFLEVKEVSSVGNVSFNIVSSHNESQFIANAIKNLKDISNNSIYKFVCKTKNSFDNSISMIRTFLTINASSQASITFRISVVEDTDLTIEDFVYKQYEQKEILVSLKNNFIGSLGDVKDELEVINGRVILHKNVDKIVLDGSETINRLSSAHDTFRFSVKTNSDNILKVAGVSDINNIMSNKFKPGNRSSTYAQKESICYGSGTSEYGDFNIYCDETKNMTVAEFKTWLSNNNVEVLYQLNEPYDIDLGTVPIALRQGYNKLTLVEDLETNTSITYLKDNVLNEEFARQLDLDITNDNLNSAKNDISSLNTDVHNSYQDILSKLNNKVDNEMITQITNRVEETVTSTEWAVNRIQDITINGVSQVQTGNGMTFNDDGLNFDREGAPVGSSVDEAGMKITDKTGASNSILQYTGFVTDEIANEVPELSKSKGSVVNYAKEYFFSEKIRGKYGQLEETEDDELGKGWGIYIGGDE